MGKSFESHVAFHCAPTLAGIKPSNIFTWHHVQMNNAQGHVAELTRKFANSNLTIITLCECSHHSLILVYRSDMLEKYISKPEISAFLSGLDYPAHQGLDRCLERLKARIAPKDTFPHEIGVFLGYPLHDVTGFINSPGKSCALRGEWKVYKNESETARLFTRFRKCRTILYQRFMNGSDIVELMA